jgi:hypothetical protein
MLPIGMLSWALISAKVTGGSWSSRVISCGETGAARRHLAAAGPHAERLGHRLIGPLALARSLDREQDGAPTEALAALTDAFGGSTEELEEIEDRLADVVRLSEVHRPLDLQLLGQLLVVRIDADVAALELLTRLPVPLGPQVEVVVRLR